jgi:hypothetical protein
MKKTNRILTSLATLLAAGLISAQGQTTISLWDFNGQSATTVPGGATSPTASIGTGIASLVGGTTAAASFGSGVANGGSTDPVTTAPANYAWQTTTYPATSANNLSAGVQFLVSTIGYQNIQLTFDIRHSNTSSRYEGVRYTLDGGTSWTPFAFFTGAAGDTWFNGRTVDFSSIAGANENANFGVQIVAAFESSAVPAGLDSYVGSGGTYAPSGTWRFDMVNIAGTVVPEPATGALFGLGALAMIFRSRLVTRR